MIQIKDIDDGQRLNTSDLALVRIDTDPDKYEVSQGDVLLLARGARLFATAIDEPVRDTIATGYFFILRPRTETVRPRYLAWYINQVPFQAALRTYMKGTRQQLVARQDIENLQVEVPPLQTQDAIVALDDLRAKEQHILTSLSEKRSQLVQALSMKAVVGQS